MKLRMLKRDEYLVKEELTKEQTKVLCEKFSVCKLGLSSERFPYLHKAPNCLDISGFTEPELIKVSFNDLIIEEETLPEKKSLFENPVWVTCKYNTCTLDNPIPNLTREKDYKVVLQDRYHYYILDDSGYEDSYFKEFFYEVTPEDVLPEKVDSCEEDERGFEGLVFKDGLPRNFYVPLRALSTKQRRFMCDYFEDPDLILESFEGEDNLAVFNSREIFTISSEELDYLSGVQYKKRTFNDLFDYED